MNPLVKFQGLSIKIENPNGSTRTGKDRVTGKPWETEMSCDYGEILNSKGMDGDPVDVFLGKYPGAKFAFVVHQESLAQSSLVAVRAGIGAPRRGMLNGALRATWARHVPSHRTRGCGRVPAYLPPEQGEEAS